MGTAGRYHTNSSSIVANARFQTARYTRVGIDPPADEYPTLYVYFTAEFMQSAPRMLSKLPFRAVYLTGLITVICQFPACQLSGKHLTYLGKPSLVYLAVATKCSRDSGLAYSTCLVP